MTTPLYANDVATTLAAPVADGTVTTFTLASATGWPVPAAGEHVPAVVVDTSTSPETVKEYVWVTALSGVTATVTRQAEDAARFPKGPLAAGLTLAAVATAGALATGAVMQTAHLRLEPAWIIAHSADAATQVLVAGDATKAIVPLAGVASLTFATTAYTGAGVTDTDILIGFGDPAGTPVDLFGGPSPIWASTTNAVAALPASPNVNPASLAPGEDLRLYLLGLGLADGDSPVDVWVTYILQTL